MLGASSLHHWTIKEVPVMVFLICVFHTDRYCQIQISIHKHNILFEHIHLLEGMNCIEEFYYEFSLDICFFKKKFLLFSL